MAHNGALNRALALEQDDRAGFDWDAAARRLVSHIVRRRLPRSPWDHAWRDFQGGGAASSPYYYGDQQPPSLAELTAWMWTPETAAAFSLLLVALTIFLCCWVSHKVGEMMCTTVTGFVAAAILLMVLLVFVSQWA